ncbi:hypothetical protein PO909_003005 [Leuciscus waleckii]
MSSINARFSQNISIVHPEYFFIIGLTGIPYSGYYYIFLFITYFITVIGNSIVLLILALHRSLHSPKYIGVFNLALVDIGETNAYISYNACLATMFFVHFFSTMQSYTLVVLAYDRFIAICLPLRYHAIVNNTSVVLVFSAIWAFNSSVVALMVSLITRLSFLYRLACNDNSINKIMGFLYTSLYLIAPLIIIVLSYLGIFLALSKITTWQGRLKALKTCVSHLLLVGVYFLPISCSYIAAWLVSLTPNARIISTSLAYAVPAMLNPIIYVLNTAEIKDIIQKVVKNRSEPIRENISK